MRNEGHVYGFVVSYASSCVCVCVSVCMCDFRFVNIVCRFIGHWLVEVVICCYETVGPTMRCYLLAMGYG